MNKKIFVVLSLVLFSSCSFFDESKGASIYGDFVLAFQKYWKENYETKDNFIVAEVGEDSTDGTVFQFNFTEEEPLEGKLKNTYSGFVQVVLFSALNQKNEKKWYYHFNADLAVVSNAKTITAKVTDMEISSTAMITGVILDGYALLRNENSETVVTYTQAANLEGLSVGLFWEKPKEGENPVEKAGDGEEGTEG